MYIPKHNEESDLSVLHALIEAHPLGTWVTLMSGELVANHIPFLLDRTRGTHGTLVAHVARANPVWKTFSTTSASLVVFQGTETYITPSWYPSKKAHGKTVPTWNYVVVHAHGHPQINEDRAWLLAHVARLTNLHEADQAVPWKVSDAPRDYIDGMLRAIVGIEIPIDNLVGKWKVSQNRPDADRRGVAQGLRTKGGKDSATMADLVERSLAPPEGGTTPASA